MGGYSYVNERIAIIGLGASGKSAAEALGKDANIRGFSTTPVEQDDFPVFYSPDPAIVAQEIVQWNPQYCVISPGIPMTSALAQELKTRRVPVISEVELAWRLQEKSKRAGRPWYCVTGTNGKTTTVGLLGAIFRAAGIRVSEVGNIGLPISSQIAGDSEAFVVELSSFQLETTYTMEPAAAICLNADADHLDWHGDVESYREAKARIYDRVRGTSFYFASDPVVARMVQGRPRVVALTTDSNEWDWVPFYAERGHAPALLADIVAAVAIARDAGIDENAISAGLSEYSPATHRQALVGQWGGVRYVDDSKATNAHAAAAALKALPPGTGVWVAGGDAKGQDFGPLVHSVRSQLRAVVAIGLDPSPIRRAVEEFAPDTPIVEVVGNSDADLWMMQVVRAAADFARPGDTVLLSPACASWDQFSSYSQRGKVFEQAVRRFQEES